MTTKINYSRLWKEDFDKECNLLAEYLLGKILVRKLVDGTVLKGRIVETECYLGGEDKASQSYGGRRTPRNEPMYMPHGTCYVYQTYGMYFCFNISSRESGAAVLLRALEPLEGIDLMQKYRLEKTSKTNIKLHHLCNGPAKLCISMNVNKENCNKLDLTNRENDSLWIEDNNAEDNFNIVKTSRIGIDSAGPEWAKKPLRFYVLGSESVSKRDKKAEEIMDSETKSPYFFK